MAKKLKRMREGGERIYPNPPTPEDLQKLYKFPIPKLRLRPEKVQEIDRESIIDPNRPETFPYKQWSGMKMITKNHKKSILTHG